MKKEELLNKFNEIAVSFLSEMNTPELRQAIIAEFETMIRVLVQRDVENNGRLLYTLMRRFVDTTTKEKIDQGYFTIEVELINGKYVCVDEYCEILTNRKKYEKLLREGVENFKFTF